MKKIIFATTMLLLLPVLPGLLFGQAIETKNLSAERGYEPVIVKAAALTEFDGVSIDQLYLYPIMGFPEFLIRYLFDHFPDDGIVVVFQPAGTEMLVE